MSDDDSSQGDAGGMPSDVILGGDEVAVENDNDDVMHDKSGSSSTRTSSHRTTTTTTTNLLSNLHLQKSSRKSSSSRTRPVVKLMVTSVSRSYNEPWRRRQQHEASGTGFLVRWGGSGGSSNDNSNNSIRIVTNAHVVRNASTVRARASFGPHVVNCEVEWLSLPLDLALLKITTADWDDFRKGWGISDSSSSSGLLADVTVAPPDGESTQITKQDSICLTLSSGLPRLDENVTCVGFPTGGTQISVTRGVVSRIDVDSHSVMRLQIDAAIKYVYATHLHFITFLESIPNAITSFCQKHIAQETLVVQSLMRMDTLSASPVPICVVQAILDILSLLRLSMCL